MGLFVILASGTEVGDGGEEWFNRINGLRERVLAVDDRDVTFHHIHSNTYKQAHHRPTVFNS